MAQDNDRISKGAQWEPIIHDIAETRERLWARPMAQQGTLAREDEWMG